MATWLSVIVPTYDGERFLAQALDSVRREPTEGVEVLVVDDGSTDGTLRVVERYAALLPLRVVPHRPSGNWVAATNAGLRAATGAYACLLHQDDLWLPGRLSAVRRELDAAGSFRLLLHPAVFVGPDGRRLGTWRCPLRAPWTAPAELVERLLVQNFVAVPSPVFDRALALAAGGLDESLWYTADWDLWLRLGARERVRFVEAPLAGFRLHPASQTMARPRSDEEFLRQHEVVLARHLETWPVQGRRREQVRRVASFSASLNVALAAAARRPGRLPAPRLAARFLGLGPRGWHRYLRDSRIVERAVPRLRLRGAP